jgi:hypothetical protein
LIVMFISPSLIAERLVSSYFIRATLMEFV